MIRIRYFITFLIIFSGTKGVYSQNTLEQYDLINKIRAYHHVESWCLGFACNSISKLYQTTDSLFAISDLQQAVEFFNDSSYVLKYYAFLDVLYQNDSIAFELLKNGISDSTVLSYHFYDVGSGDQFIKLIAVEYLSLITAKYLYGGMAYVGGHGILSFPPKNKKLWKLKSRQYNLLLSENQIVIR